MFAVWLLIQFSTWWTAERCPSGTIKTGDECVAEQTPNSPVTPTGDSQNTPSTSIAQSFQDAYGDTISRLTNSDLNAQLGFTESMIAGWLWIIGLVILTLIALRIFRPRTTSVKKPYPVLNGSSIISMIFTLLILAIVFSFLYGGISWVDKVRFGGGFDVHRAIGEVEENLAENSDRPECNLRRKLIESNDAITLEGITVTVCRGDGSTRFWTANGTRLHVQFTEEFRRANREVLAMRTIEDFIGFNNQTGALTAWNFFIKDSGFNESGLDYVTLFLQSR